MGKPANMSVEEVTPVCGTSVTPVCPGDETWDELPAAEQRRRRRALTRQLADQGYTQARIAELVHVHPNTVANDLRAIEAGALVPNPLVHEAIGALRNYEALALAEYDRLGTRTKKDLSDRRAALSLAFRVRQERHRVMERAGMMSSGAPSMPPMQQRTTEELVARRDEILGQLYPRGFRGE